MVPVVKLVSCPSSVNDHRNWRQLLAMAVYRESALSRGPDAAAEDGTAVETTAEDATAEDSTAELCKKGWTLRRNHMTLTLLWTLRRNGWAEKMSLLQQPCCQFFDRSTDC